MSPLASARAVRAELDALEEQRKAKLGELKELRASLAAEIEEIDRLLGEAPQPQRPVIQGGTIAASILALMQDGRERAVPEIHREIGEGDKGVTNNACVRLARLGHLRRVARGLYVINR